mgnify:CR=1 FL=1
MFKHLFYLSGILAVMILFGIFTMLMVNGIKAFSDIDVSDFLFGTIWSPSAFETPKYGILSLLISSLLATLLAMIIAVPIGVGAAAYLAEFAPKKIEQVVKPAIEMLAAIPSVTIGFIGIVLLGPWIAQIFQLSNGLNALNGAILLAIMSLPTIISISEDAMLAVPHTYKEAGMAVGANKWEILIKIILPAAGSGVVASIMLGMGRAIGETMAVLMATGNAPAMPKGIFSSVQPLTATIAIEMGEVPYDTTHYYSLFSLGIILFLITLVINLIAERIGQQYAIK